MLPLILALFLLSESHLSSSVQSNTIELSRERYAEQLYGFWLGQCIANWTGLITEMDKVGSFEEDRDGAGFYTRENWGGPDEPNIWGGSDLSETIDFYTVDPDGIWGADDDTDLEYMYQFLADHHGDALLTPEQIRDGWLTHIYSDENTPFSWDGGKTPENYLWVSNQAAHDLMREGKVPPETSDPLLNPHTAMIDAQLTTEIFGLFAPGRPEVAIQLAHLPIRTTARDEAAWIAEFSVRMHSLVAGSDPDRPIRERLFSFAKEARSHLAEGSYPADMYDFVWSSYQAGYSWENTRDALHERYQIGQAAGYTLGQTEEQCRGCFAAGINFAASLVSLFYGEGDLKETIKIGVLAGWDSDNPTATWGGLIGFMLGKQGVEKAFGQTFSNRFNIHRTRGGFPDEGLDTFEQMSETGLRVVDSVVVQHLKGATDAKMSSWIIPR